MEKLERDIFLLGAFIYKEKTDMIFHSNTNFGNADYIYPWTNENLSDYYEKKLSGKRVLSVTSSGDHLLHAVLGGSKDIVAFDINHFAKYYAALKIALIKKYDYDDFFDYIECLICECPFLFINIINDVKEYLTTDEYLFWKEYIDIISSKKYLLCNPKTLFNIIADKTFNAYYDRNTYRILKDKLFDAAVHGQISKQLKTDSDIRTYLIERNIPTVTNEDALPDNWCSALLKNVCDLCTGTSINEKVKKDNYLGYEGGLPYIGTKDVGFDKVIDYDNGVRIPFYEPGFVVAESSSVLLCIEGGSAGRKIAITNQDVCYGNKLCKFHSDFINPRYIYYFLQSPSFKKNFRNEITGLIDGVGINKLKAVVIPIPPIEEQQRIVDRINELLPMLEL